MLALFSIDDVPEDKQAIAAEFLPLATYLATPADEGGPDIPERVRAVALRRLRQCQKAAIDHPVIEGEE